MNNEIILYQPDNSISLKVRVEEDTVLLSQAQMTELFLKVPSKTLVYILKYIQRGRTPRFNC